MDTLLGSIDTWWAIYGNVVLTIGINGLLALSIWLTLACGMLSIGNAAFMGVGAYAAALATMNLGWPFPIALVAGMLVPAALAFVIGKPTLRLSGIYLAMATLGFGEVVRITLLNWESLTGGALGLNAIPQLTTGWHVAIALALVVTLLWRLRRSKVGRAFEAIKEDETAAGLMGIDVQNTKLFAFVLGAAVAGLAGGLDAHLTFFIGPQEFGFDRGVEILTMAVLGGVGSLPGPLVGAALLTLLPELLRSLRDFRLVINGLILVVIVLFLPRGIWDPQRFRALLGLKPRRSLMPKASSSSVPKAN
jgi:branched-chain amino acid transport system permease protein